MKAIATLKKSGIALAGAVPLVALANIQPAAASHDYSVPIGYPNCSYFRIGMWSHTDDSPSHGSWAFTDGTCNYSGLLHIRIQYKDYVNGPVYVGEKFVRISPGQQTTAQITSSSLSDRQAGMISSTARILKTCHQGEQDDRLWGPAVTMTSAAISTGRATALATSERERPFGIGWAVVLPPPSRRPA